MQHSINLAANADRAMWSTPHSLKSVVAVALAAGLIVGVSGCSSNDSPADSSGAAAVSTTVTTTTTTTATTAASQVAATDTWVKAAKKSEMSAGFGTFKNNGTTPVNIVSATSKVSNMMQLHETVADASGTMTMRQKDGGFEIAAGSELKLEPGGDHIMFMGLNTDVMAGDDVSLTLTFSDGSTLDLVLAAKDYTGANEHYDSSAGDSAGDAVSDSADMDSMNMDGQK